MDVVRDFRFAKQWFANTTDALFNRTLPWTYRWRLLALQPISLLTYCLKYLPYAFTKRYTVIDIPTRGRHTLRAIVFRPRTYSKTQLHPLHLDFHGGAFLGGLAEFDAVWCEQVSDRTGAVTISAQYRYTPANIYPSAHEDAEDVVSWVLENARSAWNADPDSLTVSGTSAGANLMFTAGSRAKAAVGFCAAVSQMRIVEGEEPTTRSRSTFDCLRGRSPSRRGSPRRTRWPS